MLGKKNLEGDQNILFVIKEDYENFKKMIRDEFGNIDLKDFVVYDLGYCEKTDSYIMIVNWRATADIFGEDFMKRPRFGVVMCRKK